MSTGGSIIVSVDSSKTFYMIEAINEHIDDLEDLYLAEQRLLDIRSGKSKTIPIEKVMKRYGLED